MDFEPYDVIILDDITKIIDKDFLFKNMSNKNDSHTVIYTNNIVNEWFYFDSDTIEVKSFYFNDVVCSYYHGFDYCFRLNGEYIHVFKFAPTIESLKSILIIGFNREIDGIEDLYFNKRLKLLDNIKRIETL